MEVQEEKGILTICPGGTIEQRKVKIDLQNMPSFNPNFIFGAYQMGADELEIHFSSRAQLEQIQKIVEKCIGFEIVNQSEHVCLIKDISQSSEMEFDTILRRSFLLVLELATGCLEAHQQRDFPRLATLRLLEAQNNRFTDYCKRILNRYQYLHREKTFIFYSLIADLERIADEYKRICDFTAEEKSNAETLKIFEEVNRLLRIYYEQFYKYDSGDTERAIAKTQSLAKNLMGIMRAKDKGLLPHFLHNITVRLSDSLVTNIKQHYFDFKENKVLAS